MRIVFLMHHDQGTVHVNVVAGFWKTPTKELADPHATLTDKHITGLNSGARYNGLFAEDEDWFKIKNILQTMLPQLYKTMLQMKDENHDR